MSMPAPSAQPSQSETTAGATWIREAYAMADRKDVEMVSQYLVEDATVHFANSPPFRGHSSIKKLFVWEYGGCTSIQHRIRDTHVTHDRIFAALEAHYIFTTGKECTVKCFSVWYKKLTEEKATGTDIYGDFNEVFQELVAIRGPPIFD
ncbi:hypothetical protein BD779DRAFT_1468762 [Infundibulicybe gibba]|nr:hypothetical protein BD779DRAFT_1468762 [Infundibulicybe gibba]